MTYFIAGNVVRRSLFVCAMLIAAGIFGVGGCKKESQRAGKVDLSTPKAAALQFAAALERGDKEAARYCVATDTEAEAQLVDGMADMYSAVHKLSEASKAKFKEPGAVLPPRGRGYIDFTDRLTTAEEPKVEGETATITFKGGSASGPAGTPPGTGGPLMKFRKIDGQWKIDKAGLTTGTNSAAAAAFFKAQNDAINDIADKVAAGQFDTPEAARNELAERWLGALTAFEDASRPNRKKPASAPTAG